MLIRNILNSPSDIIWEIISEIDSDPSYWHGIKRVKNLTVKDNTIVRETVISFRHSKCEEVITLEPPNRIVTQITKGPIIGTKILNVMKVSDGQCTLEVNWNIQIHGYMKLFSYMIKKHISKGTINAIDRIAREGELRYNKTNKHKDL